MLSRLLQHRWLAAAASILAGIVLWDLLSRTVNPMFLPSPRATWASVAELWSDGTLLRSVLASSQRIAVGWGLGLLVGIPLGILMGHFRWLRRTQSAE